MPAVDALHTAPAITWKRYLELTKPRVVALLLFTALVGMLLEIEGEVPWGRLVFGLIGIGLASAAGAAINHVVDRHIDGVMQRTQRRPLPSGELDSASALAFAALLGTAGVVILATWVNLLTTLLTFGAMIGYAVIYTLLLKRTTPQNVVWGGAAGAAPPLLGAAAITGQVTEGALLLFLIVFIWTPPHFWPLAIRRRDDYRNAAIPMLPVTHGLAFAKTQVLLYSFMLLAVSLLPFAARTAGWLYLAGAVPLGLGFIVHAWRLYRGSGDEGAMATFRYSIVYLFVLFALLLADHSLAAG
jgi:protoheme IX farnesyltransferase